MRSKLCGFRHALIVSLALSGMCIPHPAAAQPARSTVEAIHVIAEALGREF